jgi:hypothetical protein
LADRLVSVGPDGQRHLGRLEPDQLRSEVEDVFRRFPGWARGQRDEGGPARLGREAINLLVAFGLVRRHPDGTVVARPALARYTVAEAVVPNVIEEER